MSTQQLNGFKRQQTEFQFSQKQKTYKKSTSLKTKNSMARLRVFNEQGIQQNEELYQDVNKKQRDTEIFSSQLMLKRQNLSQFLQTQANQQLQQQSIQTVGQDSSQQDEQERPKFFNLITQLKMKKIARNFINSLPLRRYKFLKSKQYALINDKSTDIHMDKSNKLQNIEGNQRKETSQIYDKMLKFIPVFYPSNRYKLTWDILQIIAIMTYMFCIPIHIAKDIQLELLIDINFLKIMLIILSLDIVVNFNTGFFEKDILSIVPLIIHFIIPTQTLNVFSFSLLFFFCKARCFAKTLRKVEEAIRMKHVALNILQLLKLLSTVLFFTHIFASIWIFTGENTTSEKTWINANLLQDQSWYIVYLKAYYFVTVTMVTVGYGDVVPQNYVETLIAIIMMLISCGVFAYTLNQIGVIFEELQYQNRQSKRDLMVLNNYMDSKNISFSLQYQIREYLDYYWKESKQNNNQLEQQILSQLSDNLKQDLLIEANKIILKDSPIFNVNFSDKLLQKTLPLIQEMHCTPEQIIFSQNQVDTHDIYFIEKGKIEVFIPLNYKKSRSNSGYRRSLKILGEGASFGERSFFTGAERNISVRSVDFTKVLFIRRHDFIELLKEFPQDYEAFCMVKDLILQGCIEKIGLKCYCCENSSKHDFIECPYIHYIPNKYKTIRIQYTMQQQREKHSRLQNKRKALKELNQTRNKVEDFIVKNENIIADQNWGNSHDESQDEYCIEEFSDEGLSSDSYHVQARSVEEYNFEIQQKSSRFNSSSDDQEVKTIEEPNKKRNSLKSQNREKEDLSQSDGIDKIIFTKTPSNNLEKTSCFNNCLTKAQNEKSPISFQKCSQKTDLKDLSPSKRGALNNLQKLKYNKPNQNIIKSQMETSQEAESPISQYKSQKGCNYSLFNKKKKHNLLQEISQNVINQDNSVCSSNNEMRATPTLKKKQSQQNKKNAIPPSSPSIQSKTVKGNKRSDKIPSMQKENIYPLGSDNQNHFVLEKTVRVSQFQKNQENEYGQAQEQSPQYSYKTLNKLYTNQQFSRQASIKPPLSTPSNRHHSMQTIGAYNQDVAMHTQLSHEAHNQWLLFDNRIREPIEDFDRQRLYSKYFTKFNYDRIIRSYNVTAMKNIKNIQRIKNATRRQTLQSGINIFASQLINSPYRQSTHSHIFDSNNKQKLSQTSHVNAKKSSEYLEDDIQDDKIKNEFSGTHSHIPSFSTSLQIPSVLQKRYFKMQKGIQNNGQFRRRSLMVKSPSFLEYVLKKYSASQDLNEEQDNSSPAPQIDRLNELNTIKQNRNKEMNNFVGTRRHSIEVDLKSIKSIQENCSQGDLDDQMESSKHINAPQNQNIPSIDKFRKFRRSSLPNNLILPQSPIQQSSRGSSPSSSSSSSSSSSISKSQIKSEQHLKQIEEEIQDDYNHSHKTERKLQDSERNINEEQEQLFFQKVYITQNSGDTEKALKQDD